MKNLPKYKLDFIGILILFTGAMVPTLGFMALMMMLNLVFQLGIDIETNGWVNIIANVIMWLGAILAFDFLVCRRQTGMSLKFHFGIEKPKELLLIFPMMFGMMLITEFTSELIPTSGKYFGDLYQYYNDMIQMLSKNMFSMIIMTVIMAPIFEEIVFRGIIMKGMQNSGWSANRAIWASAILFGIVHGNPWQLVGGVLLGFVLGKVYHQTQSLLIPILLHLFNNGLSVILLYMGIDSFSEAFGVSKYIILGIGIVLFSVFYYLFSLKQKNY